MVVSGLLSPGRTAARCLARWEDGDYDLIASPRWLVELDDVASRPKFAGTIDIDDVARLRSLIVHQAVIFDDPPPQPGLTPDPKDDYLVALARAARCDVLVAGDRHLLVVAGDRHLLVLTPRAVLDLLEGSREQGSLEPAALL